MSETKIPTHSIVDENVRAPKASEPCNPSAETEVLTQRAQIAVVKSDDLCFLSPSQAPDELGRLGSYRILRVVGIGGMGMVLEAEDPRLKRHIAIKVMKPEIAAKEDNRQRFLKEAQLVAAVEHDHIVPIHQVSEENGVAFFAMPFLKGESLFRRMKHGPLSVHEILTIGRQIAEGLAAAHKKGLIHRDIKPGNVWLEQLDDSDQPFRVRILDFGLARLSQEEVRLTQSGTIVGTPAYMAPEQARGHSVDSRADLFSLGVILYEIGTTRRPFTGDDAIAIASSLALDTPASPIQLNPDLPPMFSSLVLKLLEKDPANRIQRAADAADVLKRLQSETTAIVPATSKPMTKLDASDSKSSNLPPLANLAAQNEEIGTLKGGLKSPANYKKRGLMVACGLAAIALTVAIVSFFGKNKNDLSPNNDQGVKASGTPKPKPPQPLDVVTDPPLTPTLAAILVNLQSPDWQWSAPENLGPVINSERQDQHPTLSADGLILIFASNRSGRSSLYECRHPTENDTFGEPVPLVGINSNVEIDPFLTPDGLTLLFSSNRRTGGEGNHDLWMSRRANRDAEWMETVNLGSAVNMIGNETYPCLAPDGLTLYFSSQGPEGIGVADIWMSRRPSLDAPFEKSINLGPEVNTTSFDAPFQALSENVLLVRRKTGPDPATVHLAVRSVDGKWSVQDLGLPYESAHLSADGRTLFFHADRRGGYGDSDLWLIRRVRTEK